MSSEFDLTDLLLDSDPDREERLVAIDDCLADDPRKALEMAQQVLNGAPRDPGFLLLAAVGALMIEEPRRAERYLKRYGKYWESVTELHLLRAIAAAQQGRWRPALGAIERETASGPLVLSTPLGAHVLDWLDGWIEAIEHRGLRERQRAEMARIDARVARELAALRRGRHRSADSTRPEAAAASHAPVEGQPLPAADLLTPPTARVDLRIQMPAAGQILDGGDEAEEPEWASLRWEHAQLAQLQEFDELLCLPLLQGVDAYWYQIETARKVLRQFHGRVLLGDEVGLGKTIEAGMVLKEYTLRGMAERVLVLAPPSLLSQWQEEMASKFGIAFASSTEPLRRRDPEAFWGQPRIVASLATARRAEHAAHLARLSWDVVVVDEAHHLKNRGSRNWKLVDSLRKRFLLLLSATPVQNNLVELYNLLTLLKPGIFRTEAEFRRRYMVRGNPRRPANRELLHELMRDVMIRNTRAVVDVRLPRRQAATLRAEPSGEERSCYDQLGQLVAAAVERGATRQRLGLRHLVSAADSSPAAAATSVERFVATHVGPGDPDEARWHELVQRYRAVTEGGKETALLELLARQPAEKVVVFAHHRPTLDRLASRLMAAGHEVALFRGDLSAAEKDAAVATFRAQAQVLLCSESGGEGRNLQFCNTLVNFDLPWNPMAIEQRIGRLHRIGQSREVFVFNLVLRSTAEERLLTLLDEKIHMFELVVGEIGSILGELDDEQGFSEAVFAAWAAPSEAAREAAFTALGERLASARAQYEAAKRLDEELFADELATA